MTLVRSLSIAFALLLPALALARAPQQSARPQPKSTGFQSEFLANLDELQDKIMTLAEATPSDKFAWRPAPGVRSISEVYIHVARGNYFLSTFLGAKSPKQG